MLDRKLENEEDALSSLSPNLSLIFSIGIGCHCFIARPAPPTRRNAKSPLQRSAGGRRSCWRCRSGACERAGGGRDCLGCRAISRAECAEVMATLPDPLHDTVYHAGPQASNLRAISAAVGSCGRRRSRGARCAGPTGMRTDHHAGSPRASRIAPRSLGHPARQRPCAASPCPR